MNHLPQFITFTGVDDNTDPAGLVQLADDYPVEFGLLFSPKRQGLEPRYPAMRTIEWLVVELPLRWAAHLCGADARSVIEEDHSQHEGLLNLFQRVQINTAHPNVQPSLIGNWAARRNLRAILQCRTEFPKVASVDVLYDASGGRGIVPGGWPEAVNTTFCGYAGGLRPENVAAAVAVISERATRYWIDMESGVRDERDRFSLEKCRAVCEAVYGPVGVQGMDEAQRVAIIRGTTEYVSWFPVVPHWTRPLSPGQQRALERQQRLVATLPQTREQYEALHGPHEPVALNRCGCNHWTKPTCPERNCPWNGKRPVDAERGR